MIAQRCVNCSKRVEWVVLGINLGLFLLKGWFALVSHSKSLLTDSFESLANFIITIVVLVSLKMASRRADEKFPYGYGKVEFLASGIVNMLLMMAAIIFIFVSFHEMVMIGPEKPPGLIAIVAAGISIFINYIAFGYGRCVGEKIGSSAILANAQINLADIGTSVAVIIAVVGSNLGFSQLDHIAAIVICILIIKVTLDGTKKAVKGLMDVSLRTEELHIRNLIEDIESVKDVGDVRVRLAGRKLLVDIDIFLPSSWSLSKGLETVGKVKKILHKKMKDISNISVQMLTLPSATATADELSGPSGNIKTD
ncbi:MAG: cation diffusion facilitator family transporter [Planctomycetota bacterium]|jgi:cation diffusion facilitator family transporter